MRHLFLQGAASPFFSRLADRLLAEGIEVRRVNFCAGDALYWRGKPASSYRGGSDRLADWLRQFLRRERITDCVLFGDRRPVHRVAIEVAREQDVRMHVFEEGYVRPHWITLERDGLLAADRLPRDPGWYLRVAAAMPLNSAESPSLPASLRPRALHDLTYHAANVLNPLAYPGYRTHRPRSAAVEWAGWAWRFSRFPLRTRRDARRVRAWREARTPYFLFPLQLNGDAQVTHRSRFAGMREAMAFVARSFAEHAPRPAALVIKNHPLDTGLAGHAAAVRHLEREFGLSGRLHYVETGDLDALLEHAAGVVTVNSTSGMAALAQRRATKALGTAIYDIPGLTCQRPLDEFWNAPTTPDPTLYGAFRSVVIHATQVHGDLYSRAGIERAVASWKRLLEPRSRLDELLERFPADAT